MIPAAIIRDDPTSALRQAVLDAIMASGCGWLLATVEMSNILTVMLGECEDEKLRREVGGLMVRNLRRVIDNGSVLPRERLQ